MRKVVPLLLLPLLCALNLQAQTAKEMDALLADTGVSYARAARFILPAAGQLPEGATEAKAFETALERGWIPEGADPGSPIRLDESAYLIMGAFSLEGGLLYSLFPGRRYAYRELVYRAYIQGRRDPAQGVPGSRLIQVLGRVLDAQGGGL